MRVAAQGIFFNALKSCTRLVVYDYLEFSLDRYLDAVGMHYVNIMWTTKQALDALAQRELHSDIHFSKLQMVLTGAQIIPRPTRIAVNKFFRKPGTFSPSIWTQKQLHIVQIEQGFQTPH